MKLDAGISRIITEASSGHILNYIYRMCFVLKYSVCVVGGKISMALFVNTFNFVGAIYMPDAMDVLRRFFQICPIMMQISNVCAGRLFDQVYFEGKIIQYNGKRCDEESGGKRR